MSERRILVIGSQNEQLKPPLSFLSGLAEQLFDVMTDQELGGCLPALVDRQSSLLLDPSVNEAYKAIEDAYRDAARAEATLFLAYIGHGEHALNDFYLLPRDAKSPPNSRTAIHLTQCIKELHQNSGNLDGLVVLLDTCSAGVAAVDAGVKWISDISGTLRFVVLTAVADRPAADGCFTRQLIEVIRTGSTAVSSEYLRPDHAKAIIEQKCPKQQPMLPTMNADEGLYLARNRAWLESRLAWLASAAADEIKRLTEWFEPTGQLLRVVEESRNNRLLTVEGVAGSGKSALAAALVRPEVTAGCVPPGFVQGIVFLSSNTTTFSVASELSQQLASTLPDFRPLQQRFKESLVQGEWERLNSLQREIIGPLRLVGPAKTVRLVFDGYDQLSLSSEEVRVGIDLLATDALLPAVHLIITARPDTIRHHSHVLMGPASERDLERYLVKRLPPGPLREAILERANGNWLVARLLCDLSEELRSSPDSIPKDLAEIYDLTLRRNGASNLEKWRQDLRPILSVLAVSAVGPLLPLALACKASGKLGGTGKPRTVRDVLVDLRGFVVRSSPGTDAEQVGLFHQTFNEYLLDQEQGQWSIDATEAHAALAEAIAELAPLNEHNPYHPLHRYAMVAEAEHLWAIGSYEAAVHVIEQRISLIPAENLSRWKKWLPRILAQFGPESRESLLAYSRISVFTGDSGDFAEALQLSRKLEPTLLRVLGPDADETFLVRNNIAYWAGQSGELAEGLRLVVELLPDILRVLGPDDPIALLTRNNIAFMSTESGATAEGLQLARDLLPDLLRVHGPYHLSTLLARNNIAMGIAQSGSIAEGLQGMLELLPDVLGVLGPEHPHTLLTRQNVAYLNAEVGHVEEAQNLFAELMPDLYRVLGPNHPTTLRARISVFNLAGQEGEIGPALQLSRDLMPDLLRFLGPSHQAVLAARSLIASFTLQSGAVAEGLQLSRDLLPPLLQVFGPDHPNTLVVRNAIAMGTGQSGALEEGMKLLVELMPDLVRSLGPDHPTTLLARNNIAYLSTEAGNFPAALRVFQQLLPDLTRVLGRDHPNTLLARSNLAMVTGKAGGLAEAQQQCRELLPEVVSALGPDHPTALIVRNNIAYLSMEAGDFSEALTVFQELLPDLKRVLGPDHPNTLLARGNIAMVTGQSGDLTDGIKLYSALVPDLIRVLGPDHPNTLLARNNIAFLYGEAADFQESLSLFQQLLPDLNRVLGPDHPNTLMARNNIAMGTGQLVSAKEGLALCQALVPDLLRVLGPDHPSTLMGRNNVAFMSIEAGDFPQALKLLNDLLPDLLRVLGPGHPTSRACQINIDHLNAEIEEIGGNATGAAT